MKSNSYKKFYESIDRENIYTVGSEASSHDFYVILIKFIEKYALREKKCLEIGSSKGIFQDLVNDYTGVDVAENLAIYYHKPFVVVSDAHLPFPDASFDALFTYAVHEHIPDLEMALEEIVRVLKPGGIILFAPAWHNRPWFAQGYAVRQYSDLAWKGKLIKFSIPFRDFFLIRWPRIILRRFYHLLQYVISPYNIPLRYKKLHANYEKFWQSDSDACNSLDPFDVIMWFKSRGIVCHGYQDIFQIIFVRTYALELEKPMDGIFSTDLLQVNSTYAI